VLRTIAADDAELAARLKRDREEAAAVLGRLKARARKQAQLVRTIRCFAGGMQNSIDEQEALIGPFVAGRSAAGGAENAVEFSASSVVPASSGRPEPMPSSSAWT
jgi:hypothetical protein